MPRLNIIVDTREQTPWEFPDHNVTVQALPVGDYSLAGFEDRFAIERKTLQDLLSTITTGRDRFLRELRALRRFEFAALFVETDWRTIRQHDYMSSVSPASVVGSLIAFTQDFGVVPVLTGDREEANAQALQAMEIYLARYSRRVKAAQAADEGSGA